jgi:outer membrane biosynthesis protein TonB
MSSKAPPPSIRGPTGVPSGGTGKYVAVAIFLLLGIIGLLVWKFKGEPEKPVTTVPSVTPSATPINTDPRVDDIPPPPPIPDAGPDTGPKHVVANVPRGDGCDAKKCTGTSTPDLEAALAQRAKQTRVCYNQALASDSTLQGHVQISVRVGSNGSVCGASVAGNDMGTPVVAQCVAQKFRQTGGFPAPKGGCVDTVIPISFVPGK